MVEMIERVQVLHGHVTPDSAYLVDDYPYGRQLRCQIRYWVETADKGAAKGRQRFVYQTTNPKKPGDPWNKPHPGTYNDMVIMFLDENEHVHSWGVDANHITPQGNARLKLRGVYEQLTEEQRATYDGWLERAQNYAEPWTEWAETIYVLSLYIHADGVDPELVNGVWEVPGKFRLYLGDHDAAVYFASARKLLASS